MSKATKGAQASNLPAETRLKIVNIDPRKLTAYDGNARTHSDKQIAQIATSIRTFGFLNPVLIGDDGIVIAGHGRVAAAIQLGLREVPTIELAHLSGAERRAYVIADNRLAELAGWDRDILKIELQSLADLDLDFDLEITGLKLLN
jgi:ParB-like chromosome segregation protein Spo0J